MDNQIKIPLSKNTPVFSNQLNPNIQQTYFFGNPQNNVNNININNKSVIIHGNYQNQTQLNRIRIDERYNYNRNNSTQIQSKIFSMDYNKNILYQPHYYIVYETNNQNQNINLLRNKFENQYYKYNPISNENINNKMNIIPTNPKFKTNGIKLGENYILEKKLNNKPESISYEKMQILCQKMETCICKIKCNNGTGTGFFCNIQYGNWNNIIKVLMTCNHVLNEDDIKMNKKIIFSINNGKQHHEIIIDKSRKSYTNKEYDITIIEIKEKDNIDKNSFFDIDNEIFKNNSCEMFKQKNIYLLHYENGEMKFSVGLIQNINNDNYIISHSCNSNEGSSGGPIINSNTFQVIGVHKAGGEEKKIIIMEYFSKDQ